MGVVNVTPDSFSDGGAFRDTSRAIEHGRALADQGADLLDIGGESTRPGAGEVELPEELARVLPVVRALARATPVPLSIDTRRAAVARAALDAGATIVNDVSALTHDEGMLEVLRESRACMVLMHMRGTPETMQVSPSYADPVREVLAFLRARVAACLQEGIEPARIAIDPGIGFGKRLEDNLALLRAVPELRSLGLPVLMGVSRKAFLGALSGETRPGERLLESAAAVASAALVGAEILRVHDVRPMRAALRVAAGIAGVSSSPPSPSGSATPPCASSPGPSRS
jgi:dihydropteroate synthase